LVLAIKLLFRIVKRQNVKGQIKMTQDARIKNQNHDSRYKTDVRRESYIFALEIIKYIENLPKDYICSTIGKQLLRSATSIGANIVEAKSSSSRKDFVNYFTHALKSANETKFWLDLLKDTGRSEFSEINQLIDKVISISNILGRSIITMKETQSTRVKVQNPDLKFMVNRS